MSNADCKHQLNCRLCNKRNLSTVIDLKKTPLANSFLKISELKRKEKFYPLKVNFCKNCSHLQLSHTVNAKNMFDDYLYLTNTSKQNRDHFKNYANKIKKLIEKKKHPSILDIASNDGTFLKFFNKKRYFRLGVDPAKNLSKFSKKLDINLISDYFTYRNSKKIKKKFGIFDVITANHVCAHVTNLFDFFKGVKNILSKAGIFSFEVSYLGSVIKKKTFDTIYHEHADYHSLKPLIKFVKMFDLEIFNFELVKAQGGSIRLYACHKGSKKINSKKIEKQILKEKNKLKLFDIKTFYKYEKDILKIKKKLIILLKKLKNKKKSIVGYGAAAKTTTLLNYFKIDNKIIDFIVDDNPLKQNRYTPGTHIPILSSKNIYKKKIDYIIILAWNYASHIIKVHKNINQ
jgi:2-polyprenyl-3-methyl-5-hydroxy-6-metoxy-1,4-benzoquinol methylase